MSYARYPEYKDSGVEWLGEVPAHWEIKRLKHTSKILSGQSPHESTYNDLGNGKILINGPAEYSQEDFGLTRSLKWTTAPKQLCGKGVILVCLRGSTTGRLNITHEDVAIGRGVAAVQSEGMQEYVNLYVRSIRQFIESIAFGSTFPSITSEDLGNISFPIPTVAEQKQISTFLDREIPKINILIEKQERLIELLKEKRQAVISHAVTKGLNPDVKMKDSAVEWLGEVPEHWDILRNRRVIKTIEQGWSPQADNRPPSVDEWGVTKLSSVKQGKFNPKESKTLYPDDDPSHGIIVKEGDFLLTRANTPKLVGDVCVVPALEHHKLLLCDLIYRVRFSASIEPQFLSAFFLSVSGRTQVKMDARGTSMSMAKISQGHIKDWLVPVPPIEEQIRIVDYLNSQTKKIAQTIDTAKRAIKLLKERRTALISAAVTGKIDVRSPRLALS